MGKIIDYYKEVKNEVKEAMEDEKNEKDSQEFDDDFRSELKEIFSYEKSSFKYIGLCIFFTLFLGSVFFGVTYLAFHKQFVKKFNTFVEKIEPDKKSTNTLDDNQSGDFADDGSQGSSYDDGSQDTSYDDGSQGTSSDDGSQDTSSDDGSQGTSSDDGSQGTSYGTVTCNNQLDGIYENGNEQLFFMFDGGFNRSKNDQYDAFGSYTINNQTITVTADLEGAIDKEIKIIYTISKDCKKITEQSTKKVFIRQ